MTYKVTMYRDDQHYLTDTAERYDIAQATAVGMAEGAIRYGVTRGASVRIVINDETVWDSDGNADSVLDVEEAWQ